jgi:hypothetical protein
MPERLLLHGGYVLSMDESISDALVKVATQHLAQAWTLEVASA